MRILLCDDEQSLVRVIEITLRARGHEVDGSCSAHQAIELFEARRKCNIAYDLMILDVMMPVASGFTVAGHARGKGYTGRIAFLTGSDAEFDNFAYVNAEYWPKAQAVPCIVACVEGTPLPPETL